jgi:hypothetical protein
MELFIIVLLVYIAAKLAKIAGDGWFDNFRGRM